METGETSIANIIVFSNRVFPDNTRGEIVNDNRNPERKGSHLRMTLIWFVTWIFVASALARNFRELNGIPGLISEIQDGNYSTIALLLASIFLLAKALYSANLYLSCKNNVIEKQ